MNKIPKISKWHVPPPLIHVLVWLFVYLVPVLLMLPNSENMWKVRYGITVPFFAVIVSFYANYSFLIPKFLYTKRIAIFMLINLVLFLIISFLMSLWKSHAVDIGVISLPPHEQETPFSWLLKGIVGLIFVTGVAVSVRSTSMWFYSKEAMHKLELENIRSELSFLKMQISPHFLFNTLNNILTLIDENRELAKQSVQWLSNLLRSILYDAEADTVTIKQEAEFLTDYSNLMRLRYGPELKFNMEMDLNEPDAPIAPLLLIPMMENVFKHGICSSLEDSSIDIKITSEKGKIIFESANAYFPKTHQDKSGVLELSLIAQDLSSYGTDLYKAASLERLLEALLKNTKIPWLRLMYLYPEHITDGLLNLMAKESRICKYADMPIQHASDKMLKLMRRKYSAKSLRNLLGRIRETVPGITLRTTVLLGFPGETHGDFEELMSLAEEIRFEHLGGFIWSPEEGTAAMRLKEERIPVGTARLRLDALIERQEEISAEKNSELIGQTVDVILDSIAEESEFHFYGRTQGNALETDDAVRILEGSGRVGEIRKAKIVDAGAHEADGVLLD